MGDLSNKITRLVLISENFLIQHKIAFGLNSNPFGNYLNVFVLANLANLFQNSDSYNNGHSKSKRESVVGL